MLALLAELWPCADGSSYGTSVLPDAQQAGSKPAGEQSVKKAKLRITGSCRLRFGKAADFRCNAAQWLRVPWQLPQTDSGHAQALSPPAPSTAVLGRV